MSLQDEYKALTHVNLPFVDKRYEPGKKIKLADIESYVQKANAQVQDRTAEDKDATPPVTVEGVIAEFTKYGSISADFDAEIHPDNVIPDANDLTAQSVVASAAALAEKLEEQGKEIPVPIQALLDAHNEIEFKSSQDDGQGADRNV